MGTDGACDTESRSETRFHLGAGHESNRGLEVGRLAEASELDLRSTETLEGNVARRIPLLPERANIGVD